MDKLKKRIELANEAVELMKEFRKLEYPLTQAEIFRSIEISEDGTKITVDNIYEGTQEYRLDELDRVFEFEMEGATPCGGGGFYEALDYEKDEFQGKYGELEKEDFIKYVGSVFYMEYRCEEINERLKEISEEYLKI